MYSYKCSYQVISPQYCQGERKMWDVDLLWKTNLTHLMMILKIGKILICIVVLLGLYVRLFILKILIDFGCCIDNLSCDCDCLFY